MKTKLFITLHSRSSLNYLDPGYLTIGNLIILSHKIFQRHITKVGLAKRD